MSLVAYASSSGDETDENENEVSLTNNECKFEVGQISDEDEMVIPVLDVVQSRSLLSLPVPKAVDDTESIQALFGKLPVPKTGTEVLEEEDDEFLHKKAIPLESPTVKMPFPTKNQVRITIPSLREFEDVEKRKEKKVGASTKQSIFSSLINMLPTPKSEKKFIKTNEPSTSTVSKQPSKTLMFVPDTVKSSRPAHNTENLEKVLKKPAPKQRSKLPPCKVNDSDSSDEGGDYFSLNNDDKLPEVSASEIAAMVSKKAADMAQVTSKFLAANSSDKTDSEMKLEASEELTNSVQSLDQEAIQALIGSQAKRRKVTDVEIIDISGEQVLPNKDEWLRTALATATTYQPTGVLTDEEPAAGTRRKHQITYLAHKAKANEAELQAMWSANRQNRRQTQNKYGF